MKRIFCILIAILMVFSSAACSNAAISQAEPLPNGFIRGKILTDNGSMTAAGIIVEDESGTRTRHMTNYLSGYELSLKPGKYKLQFTRGAEFSIVEKEVEVESLKIVNLTDVRLVRLYDSYFKGYIGGDLHQHTYYSDGFDNVHNVLLSNITNGLYYGFLSDHNSAMGLSEWNQGNRFTADIDSENNSRMFKAYDAVEVTTEFGHYQSLGVGLTFDAYEVVLREAERSLPKAQRDAVIKERIKYIGETITREGGLAQINHPYSSGTMGFNYWETADYFDTIEIWNGVYFPGDGRYESANPNSQGANYKAKIKWFELLSEVKNGAKFHAATGGTDNHEVAAVSKIQAPDVINNISDYENAYQRNGRYSGVPTTFAKVDGEITQQKLLNALRKGNSFISNGPVVIADAGGVGYGGTAVATGGKISLNLEIFNRDGFEKIKIIKNGAVAELIDAQGSLYAGVKEVSVVAGDYILIEVLGKGTQYAITNPIFIG